MFWKIGGKKQICQQGTKGVYVLDFLFYFLPSELIKKYLNTTKLYLHVYQIFKLRIKDFGVQLCFVTKYDFFSSRGQKSNIISSKCFCQKAESHKRLLLLGIRTGQNHIQQVLFLLLVEFGFSLLKLHNLSSGVLFLFLTYSM